MPAPLRMVTYHAMRYRCEVLPGERLRDGETERQRVGTKDDGGDDDCWLLPSPHSGPEI